VQSDALEIVAAALQEADASVKRERRASVDSPPQVAVAPAKKGGEGEAAAVPLKYVPFLRVIDADAARVMHERGLEFNLFGI